MSFRAFRLFRCQVVWVLGGLVSRWLGKMGGFGLTLFRGCRSLRAPDSSFSSDANSLY